MEQVNSYRKVPALLGSLYHIPQPQTTKDIIFIALIGIFVFFNFKN